MTDEPAERPHVLVLLVHRVTLRTAVVDLLDVPAWQRRGYVIVVRDPFTMDAWQAWRRNNPEAA